MKLTIQDTYLHIQNPDAGSMDELLAHFSISRKMRYTLYQDKRIEVNGTKITQTVNLQDNDTIRIDMIVEEDAIASWDQPLHVVYEDMLFLIVEKPAGMLVHSDGVNTTHTLNNIVKYYYEKQHLTCAVRPIHRLDVETSGLVIYCKISFFQPMLDALLQQKKIARIYLGIVSGTVTKKEQWIEKPIGRDRHNAKKMGVFPSGNYAATKVMVRKKLSNATLVECHLKTGRTHQIRVHLASIGHPLLSDPLYGRKDPRIARCALHAWKVKLYHPILQTTIEAVCEMSEDMRRIVKNKPIE